MVAVAGVIAAVVAAIPFCVAAAAAEFAYAAPAPDIEERSALELYDGGGEDDDGGGIVVWLVVCATGAWVDGQLGPECVGEEDAGAGQVVPFENR